MIGEISLFGVYVPALLLLAVAALAMAGLLSRILQLAGFYRLIAYRPLVDLCLFMFILGLLVHLTIPYGQK
ncbi:DUF1656 domain-containing protein [Sphingomonas nostoxanthinifaciens]|uniref:DUF1656 domain-containing protein n=1 Tax=Sphingomonas nostoxanthinifaciens TaxID=2872652 RepID=UPI001CC1C25A|nr:DUF1656 domain-containing protein [Sphingomonas nostoxanthinifaciens]UAK23386.1 DUF1656 domain-containing protein [Sphingomonas nostoxanthinifaciens]